MKNRWKVLIAAMGLALVTAAPATAELKIGVIEPQKVLDNTGRGKKIKDTLQEYVKSRQRIIDLEEEELKKMEEDLVKQGAVLSPEAKKDKEESFRRRMMEYQRKVQQLNGEVQGKKNPAGMPSRVMSSTSLERSISVVLSLKSRTVTTLI